jgi:mycofactocin glycosyltransferase
VPGPFAIQASPSASVAALEDALFDQARAGASVGRRHPEVAMTPAAGEVSIGERPLVSVIVPVRNRPHALEACLSAVAGLRYPRDRLEVIVVDDASTDETPAVAERLASRLVRMPSHRGQSACRNAGVRAARGTVVAFTDSDCLPEPDWVEPLVAELEIPGVAAAGGSVRPPDASSRLARYEEVRSPQDHGDRPARVWPGTPVSYLASCNLLVRRDEFEKVEGFDPDLHVGEDVDLVWRLCARGCEVRYQPAGRVRHEHRDTLLAFMRRRAFYAGAEPLLLRRHPENVRRLQVPVGFAAGIVWAAPTVALGKPELAAIGVLPVLAEFALAWRRGPAAWAYDVGSFVYHGAVNVSRYYSLPAAALSIVVGVFWRPALWLLAAVAVLAVAPAVVDWWRLRPRLSLPVFAGLYVLDNLAYHVGVLRSSLRHSTVAPLRLTLRWRTLRSGALASEIP